VDEALQFAKDTPAPEPKALYEDVYVDKPYFIRTVESKDSVVVE